MANPDPRPEPGPALADPLSVADVRAHCSRADDVSLHLFDEVASTNLEAQRLWCASPLRGRPIVVSAEYQRAGRGRRGRAWQGQRGSGLYLSLACRLVTRHSPAALGLACGVATARTLREFGAAAAALKWPNDIIGFIDGGAVAGKLGGILVESTGVSGDGLDVVIGVGINVSAVPAVAAGDGAAPSALPAFSLYQLGVNGPIRNRLLGRLIDALLAAVQTYERAGFARFREAFGTLDAFAGARVRLIGDGECVHGRSAGVDADGALLLELDDGRRRAFFSGDLSLRPAP
jgi:BirA family biotin operon repressor/biotin-[acetyl-CoA-carboxylase] ligase